MLTRCVLQDQGGIAGEPKAEDDCADVTGKFTAEKV